MYKGRGKIGKLKKVAFFAVMAVALVFLFGTIVMYLWNMLLPEITGVKTINFWQAIGLFILARILFGGFRWGSPEHRKKWKNKRRAYWERKMDNMDDDKKNRLKERWNAYCDRQQD